MIRFPPAVSLPAADRGAPSGQPRVERLGPQPYLATWHAMRRFTDERGPETADELWFVEHPPVFTQGQAGKAEHVLAPGDIEVVATDRGGQVTYHGPGQLVVYVLVDLVRAGYGVRSLVSRLERTMVATLAGYRIAAYADTQAPGVYVDLAGVRHKIGSLGLRVRRGRSYHGLALNVDLDLEPFSRINPCGCAGLAMTQVADLGGPGLAVVASDLEQRLRVALAEPRTRP